jgi:FkbM family methyltransferase
MAAVFLNMDLQLTNTRVGRYNVTVIENDEYISRMLLNGIEWDGWMREHLWLVTDPQKDILDIGGNIGWNALMFSEYGTVHTFEPVYGSVITKNIDQNTTDYPIILYPYGLSNVNTVSDIWVPENNDEIYNYGGTSLIKNAQSRPMKVELKRLDDVYSGTPGLIKVDVEGHELEVLKGAEQTIRKHSPNIYIEIFSIDTNPVTQFLDELGYYKYISFQDSNYLFRRKRNTK